MIYSDIKILSQEIDGDSRLISLDVGTKRIGVAISDASRFISNPKLIISRKSDEADFMKIKELTKEYKTLILILGLPINMDGTDNKMTEFVKRFTNKLDAFLPNLKIMFFDERLTSHSARQIGLSDLNKKDSSKRYYDDIAASLILQDFLDLLNSDAS